MFASFLEHTGSVLQNSEHLLMSSQSRGYLTAQTGLDTRWIIFCINFLSIAFLLSCFVFESVTFFACLFLSFFFCSIYSCLCHLYKFLAVNCIFLTYTWTCIKSFSIVFVLLYFVFLFVYFWSNSLFVILFLQLLWLFTLLWFFTFLFCLEVC